jgi:TolB-like protein/Tfp pilus assembly protein PilF/predicted Ser/Thr protein kinase
MPATPGMRLGPYELIAPLGAGGMGEVFKAKDTRLGRTVAIKVLRSAHTDRFEQEARAIAALNHPHICTLHDIGPNYLVMEYVEGSPLRGPMPPAEAMRLALQIAGALEAAHAKGIIHRDLKPENIIVTPVGVKLLDFGLAKLEPVAETDETIVNETLAGTILGTIAYMSPEQVEGKPADGRSDIFSFGLVLYEMLSGRQAFRGENSISRMAAILNKEPEPLEAPQEVARIVTRCLRKSPVQRFQNMKEVKAALESVSLTLLAESGASIAVLPFANLSGDKDNEYFSDGLAEEILNALTKLHGLKVAARTSAFAFKGRNEDIRLIGETLRVTHILEGSVRKAGSHLRITAQLISIADGCHVWSERYDREMTDIFAVQDEISQAIVTVLKLKLGKPSSQPIARRPTEPEAYESYLKGRFFWNKRTEADLNRSIECFLRAIQLDPAYALAYAGLSDAYVLLGIFGVRPPGDVYPKAKAAAEKALEIDETLGEAHAALGHILTAYDWDFAGAEPEYKRALELNPNYPTAHQWYGHLLVVTSRYAEAIAEVTRARDLDPLSVPINAFVGLIYMKARQFPKAIEASRKVIELDPNNPFAHWILARSLDARNELQESLAESEKAVSLSGRTHPFTAQLGYAYARIGERDKARQIVDQLMELSSEKYINPYDIALIYTGLGEKDRAFEWLEKAYQERSVRLIEILDPSFDTLRSDQRLRDLVKRIGFPH